MPEFDQAMVDAMVRIIERYEGHIEGDDARALLTALSRDYLIVPRDSGEERDAEKDLAMCEAATGGPWIDNGNEIVSAHQPKVGIAGAMRDEDCAFIAQSRTITPYWIKQCLVLGRVAVAAQVVCETAKPGEGPWGYKDVERRHLEALEAALKEVPHA